MIYIFDKTQAIIKVLSNDDFTAAHLNFKINTATTFEFSLPASKALPSGSKYVAIPHPLNDSKFIMLRLTERVDNTETIDYSAYELAYQELATDGYIEDKRPQNQSALNLMKIALDGSNWELNNVNVSGAATTNFYYVDRLSAISKVVDLLGGEIVFYIEIQGNAISGRYMDYLARQGADTSKVFASGSNLLTVERQSDTSNIYTAILPRGKGEEIDNGDADTPDGYGRRINIAGVEWKKSAGNPLDKPKGSIILSDPDATAEWGQINGNARLLLQTYDDIDDVNVLINSAYKTLQSVNHPQIQYSATVADVGGLSLGDTVLIMHGDRDLSYKTRVFEVKYDLLSPDQTELSLGDDLSSNSITSQINNLNAVADTTSSQTQWTINQIGRPGTTYGATAPDSPKVGDIWFKYLADGGTEIHRWNGDIWELLASPTTADDIATAVDDAVAQAKAHTDEVKQGLSSDIATAKSQATSQANAAEANAKSAATSQFTQAQSALSAAKTDLTNSIASEASARNAAVAAANSQAQTYANQAKADAMSAASSADGVIRTAISSSANSLSATITQNKSSADSGISTAQTTAKAAVDGLAFKVSKTDYDQKTGDLSTKINDVKETADSSAQTIADIKTADGKQDARMAEIENTASGLKSTVSDISTEQGKHSGYISTLQQRADGFDATVTKVNGLSIGARNYWSLSGRTLGSYIDVDGTIRVSGTGLTAYNPNYFSVSSGKTIIISILETDQNAPTTLAGRLAYYDSNKTFMSVSSNIPISKGSYKYVVPDNVAYFRMSLFKYDDIRTKVEIGTLATDWTPAPEDVDSATAKAQLTADNASAAVSKLTSADGIITKAQADIQANADAITAKVSQTVYDQNNGNLTQAISKAQSTADGASSTVGNYQTSNDKRVSDAESKIEQNSNDITARVSQTDYDQKTGKLSGDISTLQQRADGFDATVTKVDNLAVGGRNYIVDSGFESGNGRGMNVVSKTDTLPEPFGKYMGYYYDGNSASGSDKSVMYTLATPIKILANEQWTISYYYSTSGTANGQASDYMYDDAGNVPSGSLMMAHQNHVVAGGQRTWKRFSNTFSLSKDTTIAKLRFGFVKTDSAGGWKVVDNIQLEKGTMTTDHVPAQEDIQSALAQVKITADNISNFVRDSSGNISSNFQTALSKTSIITGSTLASSIQTQTATQITSALTDNNGKIISLINQDASGVQIAGKNIVLNGDTTVTGAFKVSQANIANGAIGTAQIGDAAITSAKIANLDVSKITGDVTNFVKSGWNNAYGSNVTIDGTGMIVSYGNTSTSFENGNVLFKQLADYADGSNQVETIGSISTTHGGTVNNIVIGLYDQTHIPFGSTDGKKIGSPTGEIYGGDLIAFGKARDFNGNFDHIFSYSNQTASLYYGITEGFNFRDKVNFNSNEIVSGSVNYNLKIGALKFSGKFDGRYVPVIVATWSGYIGGGIAFGGDNVVAFNQTQATIIS